jgi:6-phosphogluconolactonase
MSIHQFDSIEKISSAINKLIRKTSTTAINQKGYFSIALSGGSLSKIMSLQIDQFDCSKFHFFFADERCVALDDSDSNYKGFVDYFNKLNVPIENVHLINPDLINNPKEAAEDYEKKITSILGNDSFDLILLGMGSDGKLLLKRTHLFFISKS